jgi:mRNA deadenylase 3'-5' endonuclease subunit Ccr4
MTPKKLENDQFSLKKSITNLENIPEKDQEAVRVVSYNIVADFFDNKDKTEDGHHKWSYRAPFVKKLLQGTYPDIMCLQELSPNQAIELENYFGNDFGYKSIFLSQTPSEIPTGAIAYGQEVTKWQGKIAGTP